MSGIPLLYNMYEDNWNVVFYDSGPVWSLDEVVLPLSGVLCRTVSIAQHHVLLFSSYLHAALGKRSQIMGKGESVWQSRKVVVVIVWQAAYVRLRRVG